MRSLILLPVGVACAVVVLTAAKHDRWVEPTLASLDWQLPGLSASKVQRDTTFASHADNSVELLLDLEAYEDSDYGFKLAIPAGWRRIVTADDARAAGDTPSAVAESVVDQHESADLPVALNALAPGYAVGFESVQQGPDDYFADYILIEILPGKDSGLFASNGSHRHPVTIDGRPTWYERLSVDHASSGLTDVDLVIYQAEFSGVGYTVGLYAIGESAREPLMAAAFEIMLQTFTIKRAPFAVS